jgi:AraC-like DNA-binding protein
MCFEKTELISSKHGKIDFQPLPRLAENVIAFQASGAFGSILLHEIREADYSIWHISYIIEDDMKLSFNIEDQSCMGLTFVLKNDIHYHLEGFPESVALKDQFNITYIPAIRCQYNFEKGKEYACFGIHFESHWLKQWEHSLPLLKDFLEKSDFKTPAMIGKTNSTTTPEMMVVIQDLLRYTYSGALRKMYLEAKVIELLRLALERITSDSNIPKPNTFRPEDIKKIQAVREFLLENLDTSYSISDLANKMDINPSKLKRGFKQLFGVTVHSFLFDGRMQKAKALLQDTDTPIKNISWISGYKSLPNFSAAFKKKFGYPPSAVKRS